VFADRIDQLKKLRERRPVDPCDWVPVAELRKGDRFHFSGAWFRVLDVAPLDEHRMITAACGVSRTVIDYLAFETVKVALPRPAEDVE
jgi:hypothetical protein